MSNCQQEKATVYILGPPAATRWQMEIIFEDLLKLITKGEVYEVNTFSNEAPLCFDPSWCSSENLKSCQSRIPSETYLVFALRISWQGKAAPNSFTVVVRDAGYWAATHKYQRKFAKFDTFVITCPCDGRVEPACVYQWLRGPDQDWMTRANMRKSSSESIELFMNRIRETVWGGLRQLPTYFSTCWNPLIP